MKKLIFLFLVIPLFVLANADDKQDVDLDGLVVCLNICHKILSENNESTLIELLNDTNNTTLYLRTISNDDLSSMIYKLNKIIPDTNYVIDKIIPFFDVSMAVNSSKTWNVFNIVIKSHTTNKIFVFMFDNEENLNWKLNDFSTCRNWNQVRVDIDKPCIDE